MSAASLLLAVRLGALGGPEPATAPAPTERRQTDVIVVDVIGLDERAFVEELALRLPQRRIVGVRAPRPDDFAYVFVARSAGVLRITLVEPDRSAYDRTFEHEPDEEIRVAASAAANLLFAVEGGALEPDRVGATVPEPEAPPPEPVKPPPPAKPPTPAPERVRTPPPPVLELGPVVAAGIGLGVAPFTEAGAFGGAGAGLDLALRHRTGAVAAASIRWLHRTAENVELDRLRIGLGAGYGWRWSSVELLVLGRIGVEPWWLRRDADAAPLVFAGLPVSRRPLVGGGAIVSPGWFHRARNRVAWRVGPRLEVAGSLVPHEGARTIRIDVVEPTGARRPAARLGGLELELGFELAFWFGVPSQAPQ